MCLRAVYIKWLWRSRGRSRNLAPIPGPHPWPRMKLLTTKARMTVLKVLAVLVCSELLVAGESRLERVRELVARGKLKEAELTLRQIIAEDPNNVDARTLLGTALVLEGVRGESLEQLTEAVRLRPNSAKAHNELGMALSRFLEIRPAREEFDKALELDPNLAEAHVNLSLILAQAGELGPAGEHLDRAIALQGTRRAAAYAHYLRAKVWAEQNENEKSTAEFQKAVQLRPDYAEAWSDLGGMRRLTLDHTGAVHALERAVALKPDDALAQYRLGQLYLQDGRALRAVKHLKQALSYAPDDRATLYNLMLALRKTGKLEEAKPIEERMAELQHQSDRASEVGLAASGLNDEGIQLEKSGDIRGALAKYRAALDLDPTGFGFRLNYALALCRLSRWQDGVVELGEVLRLDPDNADAAKALYIAKEQAKAQPGDIRKHP
jgi:tetratricopeptide (TPR) repeat protein